MGVDLWYTRPVSSRARKAHTRAILAAHTDPPATVRIDVVPDVARLLKRVMPSVGNLRSDVEDLLDQIDGGRHPTSVADELKARLEEFLDGLGG